jgi:hypothetical protein
MHYCVIFLLILRVISLHYLNSTKLENIMGQCLGTLMKLDYSKLPNFLLETLLWYKVPCIFPLKNECITLCIMFSRTFSTEQPFSHIRYTKKYINRAANSLSLYTKGT